MAPQEVHRIVEQMRSQRDEEILDLIRETVAQLNKLGDRLESYLTTEVTEHVEARPAEEESPHI